MLSQARQCSARNEQGQPCRQPPLREASFCFWHSPDHAKEAAEARRLGGLRRRREGAVAGAYELGSLETVAGIRRLLEIAIADALGLENSLGRVRLLVYVAVAAAKLLEVGELEQRLEALEGAMHQRQLPGDSVFDTQAVEGEIVFAEFIEPEQTS
jgi:hypothetical protein